MEEKQQLATWGLKLRLIWAHLMLLIENAWTASTFLFVSVSIFVALSFAGAWEYLPIYLHLPLLIVVCVAGIFGSYKAVQNFHKPNAPEIFQVAESRSGVLHRPLQDINAPEAVHFGGNDRSSALWALHVARQRERLANIRFIAPKLWLSMGDPLGLRAMSLFAVVVSVIFAGGHYQSRILAAVDLSFSGEPKIVTVDIWASPPEYTGQPPKLLYQGGPIAAETIPDYELPEGSRLVVNVSGLAAEDEVMLKSGARQEMLSFVGSENFQGEFQEISKGNWQLIGDGDLLSEFNLFILPDLPPVASLLALPFSTSRSALQILGKAEDDYGVNKLQARFTRNGSEREVVISLPFPEGEKSAESQSYSDLTSDLWAGLAVKMKLEAVDVKGQVGRSRAVEITLPERRFNHPVARVLVEERKKIAADPKSHRIPVIATLDAISSLPEAMENDWGVILSISVARSILIADVRFQRIEEAAELLWQAALKLENGELSVAEQALREAEQALMEALNRGADDAEISRLVDDLKQAMNRFLQELAEKAMEGENLDQLPELGAGNTLAQEDLNRLLSQVDDLAKSGARSAARDLLNELQNILENLQAAGQMGMSPQMQSGQKMLQGLDDLMNQQQRLMDDSFSMSEREARDAARQAADPNALPDLGMSGDYKKLRERQEALRQQLGEMMGELGLNGDIPAPFGRAERAMNAAREALSNQQAGEAQRWQQQVLEQLQQSAAGLAEQMMQGQGAGAIASGQGSRAGEDPLGRGGMGRGDRYSESEGDRILGGASVSRARAVLNELRRRLNDPSRSQVEKEYLRRLMQRFN